MVDTQGFAYIAWVLHCFFVTQSPYAKHVGEYTISEIVSAKGGLWSLAKLQLDTL